MLLKEGNLIFEFPNDWYISKYDDWPYYRNQFQQCCGSNKAVDFLAIENVDSHPTTLWLIEVKDYRLVDRTKAITLWDEIAIKVRDTLAGLVEAKMYDAHAEHNFARNALRSESLRVVLHLEQAKTNLRGRKAVFNPADVQQKLKQSVKTIDAHPLVISKSAMGNVAWDASDAER